MNKLTVFIDDQAFDVDFAQAAPAAAVIELRVNGEPLQITLPDRRFSANEVEWLIVDDRPYEVIFDQDLHWLRAYGGLHAIEVRDREATVHQQRQSDGRIKAPIPGLITRVLVEPGQTVALGQTIIILEAMKMENEIRAPIAGVVSTVLVTPNESVTRGALLVEIVQRR